MRSVLRPWAVGCLAGGLSPAVYLLCRQAAESLGYSPFPMFVSLPNTLDSVWVVAPGGAVAGFVLAWTLGEPVPGQFALRATWGGLLGAVLGWANVPVSVLVALLAYVAGGGNETVIGVLTEWIRAIPWMLAAGFPLAVPCGAVLGYMVALAGLWTRPARATPDPGACPAPDPSPAEPR